MVLNWTGNSELKRTEVLMNVLYDLGMAQSKHIEAATGWNYTQVKKVICRMRKNLREQGEDEQDWLRTLKKRFSEPLVYYLGPKSIYQVEQLRENFTARSTRGLAEMQSSHYLGINNIFYSAVQSFGREHLEWYSEYETAELIMLVLDEERKKILRPDAKMRVGNRAFFIEFDNQTVGPRKLDEKFKRYIEYAQKSRDRTPALWVTLTESRRDFLERNWRINIEGHNEVYLPQAYFYVAGEEVNLFKKLI